MSPFSKYISHGIIFTFYLYGYTFFYECPIGITLHKYPIKLLHLNYIKIKK